MPWAPKVVTRPRPAPEKTAARGYDGEHQRLRAEGLAAFPLCQRCGEDWSTDYHHADGNPFNRSLDNRLMVCKRCHRTLDDERRRAAR